MITLKEILYDYAYTKGGGLPLTPQEMCNAVVQWVQKYLKDEKYVKELTNQDSLVTLEKSTNVSGDIAYDINIDISELGRKVILKPVSVSEDSVPVLGASGLVSYKPVSELGGGLYRHYVTISTNNGDINLYLYTDSNININSYDVLRENISGYYQAIYTGELGAGLTYIALAPSSLNCNGVITNYNNEVIPINLTLNKADVRIYDTIY